MSRRHLYCDYLRKEAWYLVEADPGAVCYLGFHSGSSASQFAEWVEIQNTEAMLSAMHQVEVKPGNAILDTAGLAQATEEGNLVVQPQEPTDLSILLDWTGRVCQLRLGEVAP